MGQSSRYNPAYAGTTSGEALIIVPSPIQPRVCGDYVRVGLVVHFHSDTTPRMRGLPRCENLLRVTQRYNPAYAGTTYPVYTFYTSAPIQPRVCGDYEVSASFTSFMYDTTPRMRGLQS